jgi:monoamine oxidase
MVPEFKQQALRYNAFVEGASFSGLCIGAKLSERGVPFTISEASTEVGGTWHHNTYLGSGVHVLFGQFCITLPSSRTCTGLGKMKSFVQPPLIRK